MTDNQQPPPYTYPSWPSPEESQENPNKVPSKYVKWGLVAAAILAALGFGVAIGESSTEEEATTTTVEQTTTTEIPTTTEAPTTTQAPTTIPPMSDSEIDRTIQSSAMDQVWEEMTSTEKSDFCMGVQLFGVEEAASILMEGADGVLDVDIVEDKMRQWCNTFN